MRNIALIFGLALSMLSHADECKQYESRLTSGKYKYKIVHSHTELVIAYLSIDKDWSYNQAYEREHLASSEIDSKTIANFEYIGLAGITQITAATFSKREHGGCNLTLIGDQGSNGIPSRITSHSYELRVNESDGIIFAYSESNAMGFFKNYFATYSFLFVPIY